MDILTLDELKVGQRLDIINHDKSFFIANIKGVYQSYFAIQVFVKQDKFVNMVQDSFVEFFMVMGSHALRCCSKVLGTKYEGDFQFVILSTPEVLVKIERRQFTRVPILMEVDYCFLPQDLTSTSIKEVPSAYLRKMKKTFSIDLSGGGIKLVTYDQSTSAKNAIVTMFIKEEIKALCSVVRIEEDNEKKNYKTALKYEDIDDRQRNIIVDFVNQRAKIKI